jgi:hypothetical protein
MIFLFFITAAYSITQIVVESILFRPFRELFNTFWTKPIYILLTCILCSSVWASFILSFFFISPAKLYFNFEDLPFKYHIVDSMVGSFFVWFIHLIDKLIVSIISHNNGR